MSEKEAVENSIQLIKRIVTNQICDISRLCDLTLQELCLFSILESLAQDYAGYVSDINQDTFTDFVLKFCSGISNLEEMDPVTFYYRIRSSITMRIQTDANPGDCIIPSLMINLERRLRLVISSNLNNFAPVINDKVIGNILGKVLDELKKPDYKCDVDMLIKQHRIVDLMYRLRCKLSHENQSSGGTGALSPLWEETVPFYINSVAIYTVAGTNNLEKQNRMQLIMPVGFVKKVLEYCLHNYMEYCRISNVSPYYRNSLGRQHFLSWYDSDKLPESRKKKNQL